MKTNSRAEQAYCYRGCFGPLICSSQRRCRPLALLLGACAIIGVLAARGGDSPSATDAAKPWAFAAFADCRSESERPKGVYEGVLKETREPTAKSESKFPVIEFVIGCGDIKLAADNHKNWDLWLAAFGDAKEKPCFFPLIGNWDTEDPPFNRKVVLPAQKNVVGTEPEKYYVDWKNVRLIVCRDLPYVEGLIQAAPEQIQHVFIADHYPIFPRYAHVAETRADDARFWSMLVKHRSRVRALLVGHTHHYSRLRVADPNGKVKDPNSFPDEDGGIYQIDCGNAGRGSHGDDVSTLVEVLIAGKEVRYRVVQAPHKSPSEFRVADEWKMP